ncbi:hypothetical protein F52700_8419 [Fusarium sp. NRRL 52700]|nr:hypothetical protein F52700_8419 [Fusarium sp. NRRL 52700]
MNAPSRQSQKMNREGAQTNKGGIIDNIKDDLVKIRQLYEKLKKFGESGADRMEEDVHDVTLLLQLFVREIDPNHLFAAKTEESMDIGMRPLDISLVGKSLTFHKDEAVDASVDVSNKQPRSQ